MKDVIIRFLLLDVRIFHPLIPWVILAIWLILVGASVSSLRHQNWSARVKWAWFVAILVFPLAGLMAYAIACLIKADWTFLKPLMQSRSQSVRSVTRGNR